MRIRSVKVEVTPWTYATPNYQAVELALIVDERGERYQYREIVEQHDLKSMFDHLTTAAVEAVRRALFRVDEQERMSTETAPSTSLTTPGASAESRPTTTASTKGQERIARNARRRKPKSDTDTA